MGTAQRCEYAVTTNAYLAEHHDEIHAALKLLGALSTSAWEALGDLDNTYRAINRAYGALLPVAAMADYPDEVARRVMEGQ